MTSLTFTQSNGIWYAEFTPTETGGVLMLDREGKSGNLAIKVYDGADITPICIFSNKVVADYACQLNIANVVVRVESSIEVVSAVFSGETE